MALMKHFVLLVQRGINSQTHSVSGRSGRAYGVATFNAANKGVVLKMTVEDYMRDAHDLAGNPLAGQQWVPEFVSDAAVTNMGSCEIPSGCRTGLGGKKGPAEYLAADTLYCATHAPNNAQPLVEGVRPIGSPALNTEPLKEDAPDVHQRIVERVAGQLHEKGGVQPPEVMAAPTVGSEQENAPVNPGGVERPVPIPNFVSMAAPKPPEPEPEPAPEATAEPPTVTIPEQRGPSAAEAIANAVAMAMAPLMEKVQALEQKLAVPAKKPAKARTVNAEPSPFQLLCVEAKTLGIKTFGRSRVAIEADVAQKKSNLPEPASAPA